MGADKLSLPWGRRTVLEHCFNALLKSDVQELVVVLSLQNEGLKNLFQARKVRVVINPYSDKGMSTSIRRGIEALRPKNDGILIALGDQPFLKTRTINVLIHAFNRGEGQIIRPSFWGRMGHPVLFDRKYKRELLNLKGDLGGRSVIERHPEDVRVVPVRSMGVVRDVDTWQDYKYPFRV